MSNCLENDVYLSIVCPAYNEEENIIPFVEEVISQVTLIGKRFELILVNDGSSDNTLKLIREACRKYSNIVPVNLARNYGQSTAMQAGFDVARGQVVVTLDSDLQNDPSDIASMLCVFESGSIDVVSGWRKNRRDKFLRSMFSRVANRLISKLTRVSLHDYGCTLKVYRASILKNIRLYGELHRFIPALMAEAGATVVEIPVNHRARIAGVSKYGLDRTIRVVLDLALIMFLRKYIQRPIQLFGPLGIFFVFLGGIINTYLLYDKVISGNNIGDRPLLILGVFLLFGGAFFVSQGIVGELIIRSLYEGGSRKQYHLRDDVHELKSVDD